MSRYDDEDEDRPRRRRRDDDDDGDDDRPRRRRRDDDDEDWDRPRKKSGGGTAVIIAVVVVVMLLACGGLALVLLLPAVAKVREAAGRAKDSNNMKQIGLAVANYHDAKRTLPPADGNLSWRVELLPYVEQQALYQQFNPNQPWDGPKNRGLANTRVPTYSSALDPDTADTRYRVFVGPGTLYEPGGPPRRMSEVPDGTANTLLAVESADLVPWPQPRELEYTPNGPLPTLGHPNRSGVLIVMLDGSVRYVDKKKLDPQLLRGLITPNGGENVPKDW